MKSNQKNRIPDGFKDPASLDTLALEAAIVSARLNSDTEPDAQIWADLAAQELQSRMQAAKTLEMPVLAP
jgi:hypothetical protein